MAPTAPADRHGFQIAIICALDIEADAVHDVLDIFWEDEGYEYDQAFGDNNSYTTGAIGEHNVVLAYMPGIGTIDASSVAANLQSSFRGIKLTLLVGVCGGVPNGTKSRDVYLGDLVISTSVIQYDFGKLHPAIFERIDTLEGARSRPSQKIRGVLTKLKTRRYYQKMQSEMQQYTQEAQALHPELMFPGRDQDHLYETSYLHKHHSEDISKGASCPSCSRDENWICESAQKTRCDELGCDPLKRIPRSRPTETPDNMSIHIPEIHFGKIGSGNSVIKSGRHRDELAEMDGVIAFEMESAGIWGQFPSFLMIKGVCDYADSHKNKTWQPYAASVAAAGMKALLNRWTPNEDAIILSSSASIHSTNSRSIGPRTDGIDIMYSSPRQRNSRQLPNIDSPRIMARTDAHHAIAKSDGKVSLGQLQNEVRALGTAIGNIQMDLGTVLSQFKSPEKGPEEPIYFKDAIGRNYKFPWERSRRWKGMESLIIQAFSYIEDLGEHVIHRRYDLIGPDKEIIMPEYWDVSVKPGMHISMMLWPLPEKLQQPREQPLLMPLQQQPEPNSQFAPGTDVIDLDDLLNPKREGNGGVQNTKRNAHRNRRTGDRYSSPSLTSSEEEIRIFRREGGGLSRGVRRLKSKLQPRWLRKNSG